MMKRIIGQISLTILFAFLSNSALFLAESEARSARLMTLSSSSSATSTASADRQIVHAHFVLRWLDSEVYRREILRRRFGDSRRLHDSMADIGRLPTIWLVSRLKLPARSYW
jgi:hypothetical protein